MINLTIQLNNKHKIKLIDVAAIERRFESHIGAYLFFSSCQHNQFDKVPLDQIKAIYFTK